MKLTPTYVLVLANSAVYVLTSVMGGNFFVTGNAPLLLLGQVNYLVTQGWYWQLFTSMFVHVNILHIASNMFFLFIFGIKAEELFKTKEVYLIYFAAGLSGNLLTLLAGPNAFYVSAGASGAIFGIFGANIIYLRVVLRQPLVTALAYGFIFLLLSLSANVNIIAHFGGLAAGFAVGYRIATKRKVAWEKDRTIMTR